MRWKAKTFELLDGPPLQELFTDDEFEELRTRVQQELLPRIAEVQHDWQSNRGTCSRPRRSEWSRFLKKSFRTLKREFGNDPEIEKADGLEDPASASKSLDLRAYGR